MDFPPIEAVMPKEPLVFRDQRKLQEVMRYPRNRQPGVLACWRRMPIWTYLQRTQQHERCDERIEKPHCRHLDNRQRSQNENGKDEPAPPSRTRPAGGLAQSTRSCGGGTITG